MSSFMAKLYLDNQVYNLLWCRYKLEQKIDASGKPIGRNITRKLELRVESRGINTQSLIQWMLAPDTTNKDGKIIFFKRDAMSKLQEIQLKKACCVGFKEVFDATNTNPMYINLTIANGILLGSEIQSKLIFQEPEEKQPPQKEPEIIEIRIMDQNYETELDFIPSNGKCYALVKTRYCQEGEKITVKIGENSEEKNENILQLSGIVDGEGYAKLEEIQNQVQKS